MNEANNDKTEVPDEFIFRNVLLVSFTAELDEEIDLVTKWPPVYFSFVYLQISPFCLVLRKNYFEFRVRNEATRVNLQMNKTFRKKVY